MGAWISTRSSVRCRLLTFTLKPQSCLQISQASLRGPLLENRRKVNDDLCKYQRLAKPFGCLTLLLSKILVFVLLQTLCKSDDAPPTVIIRLVVHRILIFFVYTDGAFDEIAKKRHVFKVETIGDSYVACAGVPEADAAHAVKMARFAYDCVSLMTPRQPS